MEVKAPRVRAERRLIQGFGFRRKRGFGFRSKNRFGFTVAKMYLYRVEKTGFRRGRVQEGGVVPRRARI